MSNDAWQLQTAAFAALDANATLKAIAPVYDGAPQNAALPYVDMGDADVDDWGSKTFNGGEHFLTLHVWSDARGKKQTWDIIEQIRATLHEAALTVTGHTLVLLRHTSSRVFKDIDETVHHGIVEFRALTQAD